MKKIGFCAMMCAMTIGFTLAAAACRGAKPAAPAVPQPLAETAALPAALAPVEETQAAAAAAPSAGLAPGLETQAAATAAAETETAAASAAAPAGGPSAAAGPSATATPAEPGAVPPTEQPPAPEAPSAPAAEPAAGPACTDAAAFAGETIPDNTVFRQGDRFVKTWSLYNAGDCAWTPGYSLVFAHGDDIGAQASAPLPDTQPGQTAVVALEMTAPGQGGQFTGRYLLANPAGRRFGISGDGPVWIQIQVAFYSPESAAAGGTTVPISGPAAGEQAGCAYETNPAFEARLAGLINAYRVENGREPLAVNLQLGAAATDYSMDMACNDRVDPYQHTDSRGGRFTDRIRAQGYAYARAYENVYYGNPVYGTLDGTPEGAFAWWAGSDIHRQNMLRSDATEIGIGYVFTQTSQYGGYYTADFASP